MLYNVRAQIYTLDFIEKGKKSMYIIHTYVYTWIGNPVSFSSHGK